MICKTLCLVAAVVCTAQSAHAATVVLEPSSKWQLDYSQSSCTLVRAFGTGAQTSYLKMNFSVSIQFPIVTVIGMPFQQKDAGMVEAAAAFGPSSRVAEKRMIQTGWLGPDKMPVLFVGSPSTFDDRPDVYKQPVADRFQAITQFSIAVGKTTTIFHTGPLRAVMAEVTKCMTALLKGWGLDPVVQASVVSMPTPIGNPGEWVKSKDYPLEALRKRKSAIVVFRLIIDETGKPFSCNVDPQSAAEEFIPVTCEILMQRARFKPARDVTGKAVASYYSSSVRWVTP